MEKEKLKIRKTSFSNIPINEAKKLLFSSLDLILTARKKDKNSNLSDKICQQKKK